MAPGEYGVSDCPGMALSVTSGLRDCDFAQLGIPTAEEYFRMYCQHMGIPPIENWNFYMAFSFFRLAAIVQGVYKRSLTGNGVARENQPEGRGHSQAASPPGNSPAAKGFGGTALARIL